MSPIREVLFSLLLNAILQVGLFAVAAAALSPFIKRTHAKYHHLFYLGVLLLCMAAPHNLAHISSCEPDVFSAGKAAAKRNGWSSFLALGAAFPGANSYGVWPQDAQRNDCDMGLARSVRDGPL